MGNEKLFTTEEAAEWLRCSPAVLARKAAAGEVAAVKIPGTKGWRFLASDLMQMVLDARTGH